MENIILGLLILQSRTIYQLRKRINDGLNLMYSCSTGSIQSSIKKLLKNGYITINQISENGKLKKVYSTTSNGKNYFYNWLNSTSDNCIPKNPELAKIYFLGFANKQLSKKIIQNHINNLKKLYLNLQNICNQGELLLSENANNEILYYQLQTATYGRDLIKFNIRWYSRLLKNIKE